MAASCPFPKPPGNSWYLDDGQLEVCSRSWGVSVFYDRYMGQGVIYSPFLGLETRQVAICHTSSFCR